MVSNVATISHIQALTKTAISLLPPKQQSIKFQDLVHEVHLTAIRLDNLAKLTILLPPPPTTPAPSLLAKAICFGRVEITEYLLGRGCEAGALKRERYELKFEHMMCNDKGGCVGPGLHICNDVADFEYCKWLTEVPEGTREKQMKRNWKRATDMTDEVAVKA